MRGPRVRPLLADAASDFVLMIGGVILNEVKDPRNFPIFRGVYGFSVRTLASFALPAIKTGGNGIGLPPVQLLLP